MEWIYEEFKGKVVTADVLKDILNNQKYLDSLLERFFAIHYFKKEDDVRPLYGQILLNAEILKKYAQQTLRYDIKHTPSPTSLQKNALKSFIHFLREK